MKILTLIFGILVFSNEAYASDQSERDQSSVRVVSRSLLKCLPRHLSKCKDRNANVEKAILLGMLIGITEYSDDKKRIFYTSLQNYFVYRFLDLSSFSILKTLESLMSSKEFSLSHSGRNFYLFAKCYIENDNFFLSHEKVINSPNFVRCMEIIDGKK